MKKTFFFAGFFGLALALSLLFIGCENPAEESSGDLSIGDFTGTSWAR
jgi:hypothetical protein